MDQKAPEPDGQPDGPPARLDRTPQLVRDRYDVVRTYATLGSVGLAFVFAVVIGTGIGLWLDRLTGWSPAFTMVFFVFGLSAGIINVYRTVSRMK
jgi:F0F1-type ATP synthase assembly protein I